ncbi:MAG TPA: carbon monoxide dehydrogenase subunit G, partial [Ramlibacter sp.]
MDMQGSRALAVTQQQAWDALNNPQVLRACIPGCDKFEPTGENQYAIGVAVKIGPLAARFAGKIGLSDIKPPDSYTISFDGQGGAAGFGKGNSGVTLTPQGTGCELAYTVHAQVGGKIGLSNIKPPDSYTISFDGQGGAAGFGKGNSGVTLTPQGTGCELA